MGLAVGVDACKTGWFVVEIGRKGDWAFGIYPDIDTIWQQVSKTAPLILIDVPSLNSHARTWPKMIF
jgi:predicted RNase H-like nuclease